MTLVLDKNKPLKTKIMTCSGCKAELVKIYPSGIIMVSIGQPYIRKVYCCLPNGRYLKEKSSGFDIINAPKKENRVWVNMPVSHLFKLPSLEDVTIIGI